MQSSILFSWATVLLLACLVVGGNYLINRRLGMRQSENIKESELWGGGFLIYAILDYFILAL